LRTQSWFTCADAHDTDDYVAVECENGERFALTPTCAANLLELFPKRLLPEETRRRAGGFQTAGGKTRRSVEEAAKRVLDVSCRKVQKQIDELIAEYNLDRATVELVGGGGGAAPWFRIAEN
jgi:hypothetical protein